MKTFNDVKTNALCVIEYFILANKEKNHEMVNVLKLTEEAIFKIREKSRELTVETLADVKKLEDFRVLITSAKSAIETFAIQLAQVAEEIDDDIEIENFARSSMIRTFKKLIDVHTSIENL